MSGATDYPALPIPLTPLLGRERDVALIADRVQQGARLLTLTGPGGVGKTRLALEVALCLRPQFADGTAFVPLASLEDPSLVLPAVAQALGLRNPAGRPLSDMLRGAVAGKRLLLVLDNCEHVLPGVSEVTALLEECLDLVILATSRASLRVYGEHEYPVAPLPVPAVDRASSAEEADRSPAVRLFVDRARAVKPEFTLTAANAPAVAAICVRLDGLPLALELAAPCVKVLPPQALLQRLRRALPLLTGGGPDMPDRQRTLRTTIAWSYGLLDEAERTLFRRLAVFAGGCTLGAAETVVAARQDEVSPVLEGLGSLVEKSLLQVREVSGEPWFTMLETIREFAQEELRASGEDAAVREAHARSVVTLIEEVAPRLSGPDQVHWTARLVAGQDNIRAAMRWLLDAGELEAVGRVLSFLWRFWWAQGQLPEARRWAEEVVARDAGVPPLVRARASYVAGFAAVEQGDRAAVELLAEALALARAAGDRTIEGNTLVLQGFLAPLWADSAAGMALMRQGQRVLREAGDDWGVGSSMTGLSALYLLSGELDEAERYAEEHLALARLMGDLLSMARAWDSLATVALVQQDLDRARALLGESVALALEVAQPELIMYGLMGLAVVAARDDPVRAAHLLGAAEALREAAGVTLWPARRAQYDAALDSARAALGAAALDAAWREGRAMGREQAVEYALGRGTA